MNDITLFGIGLSLFITELGIVVTALSAAVGIWIERDHSKPTGKPIALTVLVLFAGTLSMYQCWQNDADSSELQADLAKVLEQLDVVATKSEVEMPDLNETLKTELAIHGRANPRVLMDLAKRIAAKGGNPYEVLASYFPDADIQAMKRAGTFDKALADPKMASAGTEKRPKLVFGSDSSPRLRTEAPDAADAGAPDAATAEVGALIDGGASDSGVVADAVVDAGAADADASLISVGAARENLKRQIEETRRLLAAAKTAQEKRDTQKKLFELLGTLDKLEKANPALVSPATTTTPAASASSPTKKPKIEIEEDNTP